MRSRHTTFLFVAVAAAWLILPDGLKSLDFVRPGSLSGVVGGGCLLPQQQQHPATNARRSWSWLLSPRHAGQSLKKQRVATVARSAGAAVQIQKRYKNRRVKAPIEVLDYDWDTDYTNGMDIDGSDDSEGAIQYFGISGTSSVPLYDSPNDDADSDVELLPGDVVAAFVSEEGGGCFAKLVNNQGWLRTDAEEVEEVHPFVARAMKPAGVSLDDVAGLAYLSKDIDSLPPLAEHLPLPARVLAQLKKQGVTKASPIQEAVFSRIHRGESVCIQSQTGTGKTLAMLLPLLTAMSEESTWGFDGDKVIVVTAYRELAVQLFAQVEAMGFYPQGQGHTALVIVGNVPPSSAILNANVIIGTPNELDGIVNKDLSIIRHFHTTLRGVVLDEVDAYTTAKRVFASPFAIKRRRRLYNYDKKLMIDKTGIIEWFTRRTLHHSRRRDFQVLAASATMCRNMARKVYRLLRWDPLGRWYNNPPPLIRPAEMARADWQGISRMPIVPLEVQHRYVKVYKSPTDVNITENHYTRKGYGEGGLRRVRVQPGRARAKTAMKHVDQPGHAVSVETAASLLDGLHDALRSRGSGSSLVIVCRTVGVTVRDLVEQLRAWGFSETEALHESLWGEVRGDMTTYSALKYNYDGKDHSLDVAARHADLSDRLLSGEPREVPVASRGWRMREERKALGLSTAPIIVSFEDASRGLHFDGIETVYMLGLPRKPETYLHLAGRVGRLGQNGGKVVSVVPHRGVKVLQNGWRKQLGPGVEFLEEPIERIRSRGSEYFEEQHADARTLEHPQWQPRLLPRGQDPFRMPKATEEERDQRELEPEPVPAAYPERPLE